MRFAGLAALIPLLAACGGGGAPRGAVESATRLLAATVSRDRVAFEAEIDRSAVRDDLRRQVTRVAAGSALDVAGGPSDFALDRMISPMALRVRHDGKPLTRAPRPAELAPLMKLVDRQRVCLRSLDGAGSCVLTFARSGARWRLVGMDAMTHSIAVAAES